MKREIKFRAKAINDDFYKGEWVYGYYMKSFCGSELVDVITDGAHEIPIQVDTLGQFTSFIDVNGKEIYEGDIVSCCHRKCEVVFDRCAFFIVESVSGQRTPIYYININGDKLVVIRSKFDDKKELIENEKQAQTPVDATPYR